MDNFKVIAVAVIYDNQNNIILTKRKNSSGESTYSYPGGLISFQEQSFDIIEQSLKDEIKQEINIDIDNIRYLNSYSYKNNNQENILVVAFIAKAITNDAQALESEIEEIKYVEQSQVLRYVTLPNVIRVYDDGIKMINMQKNLLHLSVAGLVINENNEFLLIRGIDKANMNPGKFIFPMGTIHNEAGNTWELLEKNLMNIIYSQTGIEITDGAIPFTDQTFVGKGSFDSVIQFFICKYKYGVAYISNPNEISEVIWKKLEDFDRNDFAPQVYQVFEKANNFIKSLT
jgi:8-oxo-dGTP diphosphatase